MRYLILILALFLTAGAPSRTYTYTDKTVIESSEVTANEDNLFRYLQAGVDTLADNSVTSAKITDATIATADIASSAITTALIADGTITTTDISSSASIPYSKLLFSNNIVTGDIANGTILNADINASAAIVDTKLATISTAGKVLGSALNTLSGIPSGAGQIPVANLGTGTGSSSNYLRGDGAWTVVSGQVQLFTSTGADTFDAPAGITKLYITMCGGGGAGSGDTNCSGDGGGGGAGAACVIKYIYSVTPESTYDLTVGAGGAGGTAETAIDTSADYYSVYDATAGLHRKVLVPVVAEVSRTINLDSGMSMATIQATIDAVGKFIPSGQTLVFQFADGTYTLGASTITFEGFFGGGILIIQGNTGEANATSLHTTQSVILDHSANNGTAVVVNDCGVWVKVYNFKIMAKTDAADADRCLQFYNVFFFWAWYNYFLGTARTYGYGIYCYVASGDARVNYVSNMGRGISCRFNSVFAYNNDDTGTTPAYGLSATNAGTIGKGGTNPTGNTADEYTSHGGAIRA